ncbi:hypothetical protein OL239_12260 [Arthrobacter sp. ATA002]|uniref:hypothetical protein n=1 Tax=Arthrobacter sp. ATA002 TaxID=2991715 RepID=UPI0022A6C053|nr:hypothetical protein [Arthrobacter sp. ATA002]WAP50778.1 hypothetical protein OL239_12260 [Arthrobacter sp. ATA002]
MPDCARFLTQLSAAAAHLGVIESEGGGGAARVSLRSNDGRLFSFDEDAAGIHRAVERIDAGGLWPGEDASSAAIKLRLFSVHLDEALETAPGDAHRLSLRSYGVVAH